MRPRQLRFPLSGWIDPAAAFGALYATSTDVMWLDSGVAATTGLSHMGTAARTVSTDDITGSIFDHLEAELPSDPAAAPGNGFALGWVGWLGYELRFETLGIERTTRSRYPDAAFAWLDRAIEFDHATSTVSLIAWGTEWVGDLAHWRDTTAAALAAVGLAAGLAPRIAPRTIDPRSLAAAGSSRGGAGAAGGSWRYGEAEYRGMIADCQTAITEGEAYQLCLTTEFSIDGAFDPYDVYVALRGSSPTHHGALLRIGGVSVLSASPEVFLSVSPNGVVESRPIKGTRPRGSTPARDAELRDELLHSEKERAENLMIVDLMRNDLGRFAELGSVQVTNLLAVESYAHVHQLVSTVEARLAAGLTGVDAVAACFPAGSMTGAPKISAMTILDAFEGGPRGLYAGAFGYFGRNGAVDLAMVIRSIVLDPDGASIGTGGGITALSDPLEEIEETRLKAAALLAVLGMHPAGSATGQSQV